MPATPRAVTTAIEHGFERSIERLCALLRYPSVGTDPAHRADTVACAEWLAAELAGLGMEAAVRPTEGMPMVVAHDRTAPSDAPHLLYYGHYDVQPADPLELWESPPFEPAIVDGPHGPRVVARGAVDDKGQLMTFIEAFRAWKAVQGAPAVRVTVFLEGEEESGSKSLEPFLEANRDELAADVCVISDTGMLGVDQPAITYMLRGIAYFEVTLHGPSHDLHSGMYGGAVVNPINALCRILAELHDENGRVRSQASTTTCARSTRPRRRPGARSASTSRPSSQAWACRAPPARPGAACSSGCGRGRPATSTASGAAIPAKAPRP